MNASPSYRRWSFGKLNQFLQIMEEIPEYAGRNYERAEDPDLPYGRVFKDDTIESMWTGYFIGSWVSRREKEEANDKTARIPFPRPEPDSDPAQLYQIGLFCQVLADEFQAAGIPVSQVEQWRLDGRIVLNAYRQIMDARQDLMIAYAYSPDDPIWNGLRTTILDVMRRLGTAVNIPVVAPGEPGG